MKYDEFVILRNVRNNINKKITDECHICKICNTEVIDRSVNTSGKCKKALGRHLQNTHNLTVNEYLIQTYNKNEAPLCSCGCGTEVEIYKWNLRMFVADHQRNIDKRGALVAAIGPNGVINYVGIENWIKLKGLSIEQLKQCYELYKSAKYTGKKLAEMHSMDWRTLKKYMIKCKIASSVDLKQIAKAHQFSLKYELEENSHKVKIDDNILQDIYEKMLIAYNNKIYITMSKICSEMSVEYSHFVVYNRLCEKYGKSEIDSLLSSGNSSIPETNFYFVLCFFFGKKNIKKQFLLERKMYDFLLYDKILIEFDGEYWHRLHSESDAKKDQIALSNGYMIFRVSDKHANSIETWNSLTKLVRSIKNEAH